MLETRRAPQARLGTEGGGEAALGHLHRTVIAAIRAGRFDELLESRARAVFGSGNRRQGLAASEAVPPPEPPLPEAETQLRPTALESLSVELLGDLPAAPGSRLDLTLRAVFRDSGTPAVDARVHAQLLTEGGRVRASLSGATDAAGQLRLRVQLPANSPSSLAVRVEHVGATILLRQDLSAT